MILNWDKLDRPARLRQVLRLFGELRARHDLDVVLCLRNQDMFETAYGYYDFIKRVLFFNVECAYFEGLVPSFFTIVHEVRHAMHNLRPEAFSPLIQKSRHYILHWDLRLAYRWDGTRLLKCEMRQGQDYLKELYLLCHNERDANQFAREYLELLFQGNETLLAQLRAFSDGLSPRFEHVPEAEAENEVLRMYDYIYEHAR